MKTVLILEII